MKHIQLLIAVIIALILWFGVVFVSVKITNAHETEEFKHGPTGQCYGWNVIGDGMRMCYTNKERTRGKTIIFNHGMWHIGPERDLKEGE